MTIFIKGLPLKTNPETYKIFHSVYAEENLHVHVYYYDYVQK